MRHITVYNIPEWVHTTQDFTDWAKIELTSKKKLTIKLIETDKDLDEEYRELMKLSRT